MSRRVRVEEPTGETVAQLEEHRPGWGRMGPWLDTLAMGALEEQPPTGVSARGSAWDAVHRMRVERDLARAEVRELTRQLHEALQEAQAWRDQLASLGYFEDEQGSAK